jgi:hypothetical protein
MLDFLIATAIAVPLVLGLVLLVLWRIHRADERRVAALAARLQCPTCGISSFVWSAEWAVNEPDTDGEVGGVTLLCNQCGKEFNFTMDGTPARFSLDTAPRRGMMTIAVAVEHGPKYQV